jgi:2'-5' RNA ligase
MTDPQSDRTSGYHLFIEAADEALQHMINELAESFGGPIFPAHVTLLSGIIAAEPEALLQRAEQLAHGSAPFELALGETAMEDTYFRALYLRVQPSETLVALHVRAKELFPAQSSLYMPHLSLLYGNYPEERKRAALATLLVPEGVKILVDRFSLYHTEGTVAEWQKMAEVRFA